MALYKEALLLSTNNIISNMNYTNKQYRLTMRWLFCSIFYVVFSFVASAQVVLMSGDYADPSVLKDGEDYYMTHSPFHYQPGFLIWHSRDLLHWEPICRAGNNWSGSAWAPDLQKVGDTYYIYFPANETNWVITAKNIRGPWSEPVDLKIGGIDPGLVVAPDGKRYLFTNAGQVTPLTDDGMARCGQTKTVYSGWHYPKEWETECMCLESPKLNWHNGYLYMTSAEGGTAGPATSHMAVCARSKDIYGPWENSPYNPIVHTYSADERWWSKGHGTIVEGPGGQWWIIYHAYNKDAYSLGRYTLMEPIEWTDGGWYRPVKDMVLPPAGSLPALSDHFSSMTLGWQWTGWKEDITKVVQVGKGVLSLPGRGSSPKDGRLMLTTATDTCYIIEACISPGRNRSQGGLFLFYDENAFAGLSFTDKTLTLYKDASNSETMPNTFGKKLHVRLVNHGGRLDILVSRDGKEWIPLRNNVDISNFHHNRFGGFIALRPCLYAAGHGISRFWEFKYQSIQ